MEIKKFNELITYNPDKKRIVLIQGSARDVNNCPGEDGKTKMLIDHIIKNTPSNVELDIIDLSIQQGKTTIQSCKGCASTAGGAMCHYKCSCFFKGDKVRPDKMYDENIYDRLESADGIMILSPIYWWSLPSQVKALFDRLVCINGTITQEEAKKLMDGELKNPDKAKELSKTPLFKSMKKNHWEGKYCAFFVHGDNGGDDYKENDTTATKEYNKEMPDSWTEHITQHNEYESNPMGYVMPFVLQMRYSGIYVPNDLISYHLHGSGDYYADGNDNVKRDGEFYDKALSTFLKLVEYAK